jgi:transcription elongation factor GreB
MAAFIPGASPPLVKTAIFLEAIEGNRIPRETLLRFRTRGGESRFSGALRARPGRRRRLERDGRFTLRAGPRYAAPVVIKKKPAPTEINYITPVGFKRLADELTFLRSKKRPEVVGALGDAAAEGDRSENAEYIYRKKQLREIDKRLRFLSKRLDDVQIVDPATQPRRDRVFFGATVTVEDEEGEKATYRIVGVDESDGAAGDISWKSPVGRALLGKAKGETVTARWHAGLRELTIGKIVYR